MADELMKARWYEEGRNEGWANAQSGGHGDLAVFADPEFWRGVDDGVALFNSGYGPDGSRLSGSSEASPR